MDLAHVAMLARSLVMNGCPFESQGPVRATWDGADFKLEPVRLRPGGHEVQVSGGGTGN